MPFVKLDCGILNSTLWINREEREVFITALLMATPREFTDPVPQYQVNKIELTGFAAPPGWYGMVEAAGSGILRCALVDQGPGYKALESLGSPDPESRSKAFEGRRLIRVDGGYLVLNFMAYRERDYGNAERCRRYRERRKGQTSVSSQSTSVSSVAPPHVNMDADAEAEAYINPKSARPPKKAAAPEEHNSRTNIPTVSSPLIGRDGKRLTATDMKKLRPDTAPGEPRHFP